MGRGQLRTCARAGLARVPASRRRSRWPENRRTTGGRMPRRARAGAGVVRLSLKQSGSEQRAAWSSRLNGAALHLSGLCDFTYWSRPGGYARLSGRRPFENDRQVRVFARLQAENGRRVLTANKGWSCASKSISNAILRLTSRFQALTIRIRPTLGRTSQGSREE